MNILLAGCGNLTEALFSELDRDFLKQHHWWTYTPSQHRAQALAQKLHGAAIPDLKSVATESFDVLYLGMKPQQLATAAPALKPIIERNSPLIISVLASTPTTLLHDLFQTRTVRLMPNTATRVNTGSTLAYSNSSLSTDEQNWIESLFRNRSLLTWVSEESDFDLLTAPSGSFPALILRVVELYQEWLRTQSIPDDQSKAILAQAILGAGALLKDASESPNELRQKITSARGITDALVKGFEEGNGAAALLNAFDSALKRTHSLKQETVGSIASE